MLSAWELVRHHFHFKGARSIDAAARSAMQVGKDGRPRRTITLHGTDGKRLSVILDAKKLRRWHDEFEALLETAPPTSLIAQRASHLRAYFSSAETQSRHQHAKWQAKEYAELRRAQEHGGRPVASADLDRLFPL